MKPSYELQTHNAEDRHWWYRGRRRVIAEVIAALKLPAEARILDAGCGSGRNMVDLAAHGNVTGIELSEVSVQAARERNVGEVHQGTLDSLPFPANSFDFAVCLDVIEHLDDDRGALRQLRRVIANGGRLLVTVPAYEWLWSNHDVVNQHRRRYRRRTLVSAAEDAGWHCERVTYFNSMLLPLAIAARLLNRRRDQDSSSSSDLWLPPRPLNALLQQPLNLEALAIGRCHARMPAGLSLLAILR